MRGSRPFITLLAALALVGACSEGGSVTGATGTGSNGTGETGTETGTSCPFADFAETANPLVQVQPPSASSPAELTARQAFLSVTSGIAQVRALEGALVSSQSSLDSTRLGQEVGVRTQVDVLNAQQLLSQTRRDLAQSKYNYVLALLRLKAAAGKLSEEDLARVNLWLDR